jgi:hypothetical protein
VPVGGTALVTKVGPGAPPGLVAMAARAVRRRRGARALLVVTSRDGERAARGRTVLAATGVRTAGSAARDTRDPRSAGAVHAVTLLRPARASHGADQGLVRSSRRCPTTSICPCWTDPCERNSARSASRTRTPSEHI